MCLNDRTQTDVRSVDVARANDKCVQVPLEVLESLKGNHRLFRLIVKNYPSLLMCRSISDHGHLNKEVTLNHQHIYTKYNIVIC